MGEGAESHLFTGIVSGGWRRHVMIDMDGGAVHGASYHHDEHEEHEQGEGGQRRLHGVVEEGAALAVPPQLEDPEDPGQTQHLPTCNGHTVEQVRHRKEPTAALTCHPATRRRHASQPVRTKCLPVLSPLPASLTACLPLPASQPAYLPAGS